MNNIPWTESPFFEKELYNSGLTQREMEFVYFFSKKGYATFDTEIPSVVLDKIRETLHYNGEARIQDAWTFNDYVKWVAKSYKVMDKLRLLYRREPIPFQTLNFPVGTEQPTHSDMIHFNSIPARFLCGVWVALEDVALNNGPLHYYPGSHKLPFYDMLDMGVKASDNTESKKAMMAYAENYTGFIAEVISMLKLQKETLLIKKGQAMVWSANLLHGGEPIIDKSSSRHSQVTHYYFEDCIYYTPRFSDIAINKLYLSDLTNINTGEKVVNKYFGQTVRPTAKVFINRECKLLLRKLSSLFPKDVVSLAKKIIK